jgi:RNA methyltransferase, TrmH family
MIPITSFSNEKIKFLSKLKDKKDREKNQKFIIEGYRENVRALESGRLNFDSLFVSPDCFLGSNEWSLIERHNCKVYELPQKLFEKISYRDRPDGILSLCNIPDFSFSPQKLSGDTFLIIEGVEKPGNLGTILRTSEGAGVSAVFVADPKIDLFNPNVIRASTGTLFTIPVFVVDIQTILSFLDSQNIPTYSVTPEATNYYFEEDFSQQVAFVFGSEQYGLSEYARKKIQKTISIPMKGMADSLNLAMSCGIILYDVIRQRTSR